MVPLSAVFARYLTIVFTALVCDFFRSSGTDKQEAKGSGTVSWFVTDTTGCLSPSWNYYRWPEQSQPSRANLYNWNIALAEVYGLNPNNHIFNQELRGQEWLEDSLGFFHWRYDDRRHILYQKDHIFGWQI